MKIKRDAGATVKKRSYRKSTIHSSRETGLKGFRQYRDSIRMSRQTVKKKNSSIKVAGAETDPFAPLIGYAAGEENCKYSYRM